MKKVIGIDLGTGNLCVSAIEGGKPVVISNSEGKRTTPSVISIKDGQRLVGEGAKRQRIVNPKNTVSKVKRFMGVDYDQCGDIIKNVNYDVKNVDGKPRISIDGRDYSPEELSSYLLAKMKKTAEDYLGCEVTDAVITVPAWFDNTAREATKLAGELAGLNVLRIINEPTAAMLASNLIKDGKTVMVADIGEGTTDFSICDNGSGVVEVLASKGDVFLGGSDWDNAIAKWIRDEHLRLNGVDLSNDVQSLQRVLEAAETAKIELSTSTSTEINLPYLGVDKNNVPKHFTATLTRAKMENITKDLVEKVIECGRKAMKAADIDYSKLSCILLVGGQTRSLALQKALEDEFKAPLNKSVNPDEAVAMGAALEANVLVGGEGSSDILLLDVLPVAVGIETLGGVFTHLVDSNTTIPCSKTEIFSTAVDNQTSVQIRVLQGERPMAVNNKLIGQFTLDGIVPAKRGIPQIEVTFDINANGILSVSAKDKNTGKEQHIKIETKSSLSDEDIERIKKEAKEYEEEDKKAKENADKLNTAENFIFSNENILAETGDKITEDEKKELQGLIDELKKLVENKEYDKLEEAEKKVNDKWAVLSNKIYNSDKKE